MKQSSKQNIKTPQITEQKVISTKKQPSLSSLHQQSSKQNKQILKDKTNNVKVKNNLNQRVSQNSIKAIQGENIADDQSQSQRMENDLKEKKLKTMKALKDVEQQQKKVEQIIKRKKYLKKQSNSMHQQNNNKSQEKLPNHLHNKSKLRNYKVENGKKIFMSEEDLEKLRKLKIQHKVREKQARLRLTEKQKEEQQRQRQIVEEKKSKFEEEKLKRKVEAEKRYQKQQQQRKRKYERFQKENQHLKTLKKSQKLYEKMEKTFKAKEQEQSSNLNTLIRSRFGMGNVNYDEIKEHQERYLEQNQEHIQSSRIRVKSKIKQLQDEFNNLGLHKSQFYQKVKNEKQQRQLQEAQEQRRKKVHSEKIREYSELVKENHKPKVKPSEKVVEQRTTGLNLSEQIKVGNQYMKQGRKLIDRNKSSLPKIDTSNLKANYRNYLQENRQSRENSIPKNTEKKSRAKVFLNEVNKEINKLNELKIGSSEKSEKIANLHQKISREMKSGFPKKDSLQQAQQIRTKLKLLKDLESNNSP